MATNALPQRMDLTRHSDRELLTLYASVMQALRSRQLVRSSNGPIADIAEQLVASALSLSLNAASTAGYDGADPRGRKVEVKCRRITAHNPSRQLGAIRNLEMKPFDLLAGVLFHEDFHVMRAALIPFKVVKQKATFVKHSNSWRFILRDSVWALPGVQDITERLRKVER